MSEYPTFTEETARPQHHIHNSSQPLPGATKDAAQTFDYSPSTIEHAKIVESEMDDSPAAHDKQGHATAPLHNTIPFTERYEQAGGEPVTSEETSPTTSPTSHEEGKAGFGDKLIGKAQKLAGKVAHKPELAEKGELRQTSGKAAVESAN